MQDGGGRSRGKARELDTIILYHKDYKKKDLPVVDRAPTHSPISLRNYLTEGGI